MISVPRIREVIEFLEVDEDWVAWFAGDTYRLRVSRRDQHCVVVALTNLRQKPYLEIQKMLSRYTFKYLGVEIAEMMKEAGL